MATRSSTGEKVTEPCDECRQETHHQVRVELRTENPESDNAAFSREPYRVTTCLRCGTESVLRMNDA